jgi:hypothetical protein
VGVVGVERELPAAEPKVVAMVCAGLEPRASVSMGSWPCTLASPLCGWRPDVWDGDLHPTQCPGPWTWVSPSNQAQHHSYSTQGTCRKRRWKLYFLFFLPIFLLKFSFH